MEVRKTVRILLLIFLVLTILFYSLYRKEKVNISVLSEEFVSGAVLNLKNSGVDVSENVIYRFIPEKDVYVFDALETEHHNELVSEAIIDVVFDDKASVKSFNIPDGVSVGIYDKDNDTKEIGRVVFSNSNMSFSFSKSGVVIKSDLVALTNGYTETVTQQQMDVIDRVVRKISPDATYRISGSSSNDEFVIISVMQMIKGHDISDVFINFVFENNEPSVIRGTWITETLTAKYHNTLVDGVNVLYKLNLENVSTVDSERIVYFLRKNESGRFFVVPGWEITYTDKDGLEKSSYFDALK